MNIPSKHPVPVNTLFVWFLCLLFYQLLVGRQEWNSLFAFIVNIDHCIIFTVWIWNASCVHVALFWLASLLCFVCALLLIFYLIADCSVYVSVCVGIMLQFIAKTSRISMSGMPSKAWPFPIPARNSRVFFIVVVLSIYFAYAQLCNWFFMFLEQCFYFLLLQTVLSLP